MALNLTNLFTGVGRAGRALYLANTDQAAQPTPFDEFVGYSYTNPSWVSQLSLSYDQNIRAIPPAVMAAWQQAAQTLLQGLVSAESPQAGATLPLALAYVRQAMIDQSKTVQECTVGSSVTPGSGNVGTGRCVTSVVRADGLIQQNVVAETTALAITADSYTGGATAGREPWAWAGQPNVSSLGTGVPVQVYDWDWPVGSGVTASGNAISASQYGSASGNFLTNGDFESWDATGTPFLDYWHLVTGTWGTDAARSATAYQGTYSVQVAAGATLTELTQQFDSTTSDGTDAAAGTPANPTLSTVSYAVNFWLRTVSGTASAGVLTVDLVDGSGTVVADDQGANNSFTVNLTALTTAWASVSGVFRLPTVRPATLKLRIRVSTALSGADVLMDSVCFARTTPLYLGGPSAAVFSGATPFEIGDSFALAYTNDRGGATYCATWQALFSRLFQTPGLILPYSGTPTIADTLITGV